MDLFSPLEHLYAKVIAKVWSANRNLQNQAVRRFQSIEADGVWHLYQVLRMTKDPKSRARIFQHILEEDSHADLFCEVFQKDSSTAFQPQSFTREDLVSGSNEAGKFLLHVHVGEVSATRRFKALKRFLPEGNLKAALSKIVQDEEGHIELTQRLAQQLNMKEPELNTELRYIRLARLRNSAEQLFLRMTNWLGLAILILGYWCVGFIGSRSARARLQKKFVAFNNNQLKKFAP